MSLPEVGTRVTVAIWGEIFTTGTVTGRIATSDGERSTWASDAPFVERAVLRPSDEGLNWMRGEGPEVEDALQAAHAIWTNCA